MKINLINQKGWFSGQTDRPIDPVATANAGEEVYADVNPQSGTLLALPLFDVATQLPVLIDDAWVVHPSYLTVNLYRTDNGEKFILGDEFDGVGDLPSWLTLTARPSEAYDWNGTKWVLNKTKQAQIDAQALASAKTDSLSGAVRMADGLQSQVLGNVSVMQQARLANKYAAAVAIQNGTASAGDHAVIDTEVSLRPKYTKAQLVDVIVAKGTAAKQAEGMVNGMLLLAQDAFEGATTLVELGAAVQLMQNKATQMTTQLLAQLGDVG